jgi:hypothetical protein
MVHVCGSLQVVPHVPQLLLSVFESTHLPLQTLLPAVPSPHSHLPTLHIVGALQTVPQMPQLVGSVVGSMQTLLQMILFWTSHLQTPAVHVELAGHLFPHLPQ